MTSKIVSNISPYLVEGSDTFVIAMKESLDGMPKMNFGNQPRDGGYFVIKEEEYQEIMEKEPELKKWIHPYIGADEFIKGKKRWCLWLKHASPKEIMASKISTFVKSNNNKWLCESSTIVCSDNTAR